MNSARQQLRSVQGLEVRTGEPEFRDQETAGSAVANSRSGREPCSEEADRTAGSDAEMLEPRLMLPRIRIDAFVESESLLAAVEAVARDRSAVRSEVGICRGGFAEAVERYREHAPADLVMIEDCGSIDQLEWQVEALAEFCPPSTRLVIIGARNDIVLYRRLIKIGVNDYLVQPVTPLALLDSIASIFSEEENITDLGLVIAFVGARGGAGSSTVAQNVAAVISRDFEATTLLIDAAIGFGTAALQFDISAPHGLADALKERDDLDREVLERLTYWRNKRFGILTAPDRPDQMTAPEPGAMRHLLDQARRLARYVILDLPHGWAPWTAEMVAAAEHVVVVAAPDLPSLRNTRTLLSLIREIRPNDEPAHVVLNRMPARGKPLVSREDFTRTLDRTVTVTLPVDDAAVSAEMAGRVLAEAAPGSAMIAATESLTAELVGRTSRATRKTARPSLLGRLFARDRK